VVNKEAKNAKKEGKKKINVQSRTFMRNFLFNFFLDPEKYLEFLFPKNGLSFFLIVLITAHNRFFSFL
jgi:hypothetical protein